MENEQEKGSCCCGKKSCCCKAIMALALLLVGGAVGFFAGRHCGKVCPMGQAVSASAQMK